MKLLVLAMAVMSPQPVVNTPVVNTDVQPPSTEKPVDDESAAKVASVEPAEKKICRTTASTGSRVAKRKTCLTKAEWDRLGDETRSGLGREIRTGANRAL